MAKPARPSPPQSDALFDELLVMMAQAGDARAFERLHRRWQGRLARAARRLTGDEDSARDLAQDCWLAIWRGVAGLRDPARFRAYAFGVLHRRGADHLRGVMQQRARSGDMAHSPEQSEPPRQDDASALREAFAALPPDQRLAAHLHFVEGLTLVEIAAVQQVPTGTAKSRLFHARRKLKAALSDTAECPTPTKETDDE